MSNILTALLELITGGLTTMATNIGAGLKAFIEGIFIVVPTSGDPTLSTFGSLIAIFAGISRIVYTSLKSGGLRLFFLFILADTFSITDVFADFVSNF